jgi:hypothetical protein
MSEEEKPSWRRDWLPAPNAFSLDLACATINRAHGGLGCFLVGSALERRTFRDVDVRLILEDGDFDQLFPVDTTRWSLMCVAYSMWLSSVTGLPVDFQFQRQSHANAAHAGPRSALGVY